MKTNHAELAHLPKRSAPAPGTQGPQVPTPDRHCPGAAAQLAAVHRTLRRGTVVQRQSGGGAAGAEQTGANRTGLPDRLKSGVEALSGVSLDGVKVHYNSAEPAQLNALAYAQGSDIHLAPGQEKHLPHEAWHVVQQAQGRVRPTLQMKDGVPVNDDAGLEREADAMGAKALLTAPTLVALRALDGGGAARPAQRWGLDQDDQADALLNQMDAIKTAATTVMTRATALAARVPQTLRQHWPQNADGRLAAYQEASDLRRDAQAAVTNSPNTRPLDAMQADIDALNLRLTAQQAAMTTRETTYNGRDAAIIAADARRALIANVMTQQEGAGKLAEWQTLATAVRAMNDGAIGAALTPFHVQLGTGLFSEQQVENARKTGQPGTKGTPAGDAVIEYLTDLFATGRAQLDTWGKFYPTNYDLKTGEFGGEWHVTSSVGKWMNKGWVFHAHCEAIKDQNAVYTGFRFKDVLGTNHLKMTRERMSAGVQLDLPLTRATLDTMALPFQQKFQDLLAEDGQLAAVLKKAKKK